MIFVLLACGSSLEKQAVPPELKKEWVSINDYSSSTLVLSDNEVKLGEKEKIKITGFEANKEEKNKWKIQLEYSYFGEDQKEVADLTFLSDKSEITFSKKDQENNYGPTRELYNSFVDKQTVLIPEKYHGTWTSCDPMDCDLSKVIITADTIGISGTGEKCVTDEATLEYAVTKVDKLHVKHSGLNSSGWSFYLAEDGENIVLSEAGESYMNGTFQKGMQKCGAKAKRAKKKKIATKKCQEYVDCVCDLGEAIQSSASYSSNVYSGQCKQAKRYLSSANGKACEKALDTFKEALENVESMYEMAGISIPYSCK